VNQPAPWLNAAPNRYSARKAIIGSTRAARIAGTTDARIAMACFTRRFEAELR
jgi:hypothetical protein